MTPGREEGDFEESELQAVLANDNFTEIAKVILEGLGGKENLKEFDYCATRVRAEVTDYVKVDTKKIKSAGVAGVIRPSKTSVQVIVGPKGQDILPLLFRMVRFHLPCSIKKERGMRIYVTKDYAEMSRKAANIISAQIILKPDSILGLATGFFNYMMM